MTPVLAAIGYCASCASHAPEEPEAEDRPVASAGPDSSLETIEDAAAGPPPAAMDAERPPLRTCPATDTPHCTTNVGECRERWCLIHAGSFTMGSPTSEPERGRNTEDLTDVTLTRPFLMQQTELTQREWTALGMPNLAGTVDDGAGGTDCIGLECPASAVDWCEAVEYINRLNDREGRPHCLELVNPRGTLGGDFACDDATIVGESYYACQGYRLPTSAEWEYAARAGTTTAFHTGGFDYPTSGCADFPHLSKAAWYCANAGPCTHVVCTRDSNPWGLHDMLGNVEEHIFDWEQHGYGPGPVTDPMVLGPAKPGRIARGGPYVGWPGILRSANVSSMLSLDSPYRSPGLGFRMVRTVSPQEAESW